MTKTEKLTREVMAAMDKPYDCEDYRYNTRDICSKERSFVKKMCKDIGAEYIKGTPMYFKFAGYIKKNGKYVYIHFGDCRFWKNFASDILFRECKDENDCTGKSNDYATADNLGEKILALCN